MLLLTELGKRLKEAREEKGITLEDLQNMTKIQKRYLIGIEQGNYDIIPGKFYVRAFIKQYAEAVGLQPEVIFDEYKDEIPTVYDEELPEKLSRVQSRKNVSQHTSKFFEFIPKIIIGVFAIGVVALIWFIFQKYAGNEDASKKVVDNESQVDFDQSEDSLTKGDNEDKEDTNSGNDDESSDEENNQTETSKEENPPVPDTELKVVDTQGTTTTYELLNADTFELKISVPKNEKAWLEVKSGSGESLYYGELADGAEETYDLSSEQSVTITTGRSISTEIFVNGNKLEYALDPAKNFVQNIVIKYNKRTEQ